MRDFQKQKLYDWENKHIRPKFNPQIHSVLHLQMFADYMWKTMGGANPPKVFINNAYKVKSTGSRYRILLKDTMANEFTLVHEIAHSFAQKEDSEYDDGHGPNYVAIYCAFLHKFYNIDRYMMMATLSQDNVQINLGLFSMLINKTE